jgi:hypothetical protein
MKFINIKEHVMSLVSLPQELYPQIFFNLEFKDLCKLPFVSKGLKELFNQEEFWRNSFFTNFPNDRLLPNETAKKQFLARVSHILTDDQQLRKVVTSFFCDPKWNKKRELICTFPNEPTYFLKISQSFGPVRGTKEGSNGDADETKYYKCLMPAYNKNKETENYITEEFTQCPGTSYNAILGHRPAPLDNNAIPLSITIKFACKPHTYGRLGPEIYIPHNYVKGKITDVDVGFGNTLGYFSEINDWKRPFNLFCITDSDSNKPAWVGLIPLYVEFKFVSIDSKGVVAWERNTENLRSGNRIIGPHDGYDTSGHNELASNLRQYPVDFRN